MKKLIYTAAVIIIMAVVFGCRKESGESQAAPAADSLKMLVDELTALQLPMTFGADGQIDSVAVNQADSVVTLTLTLDDDLIDSAAIAADRGAQRFLLGIMTQNDTMARVLALAAQVPVSLNVTVAGRETAVEVNFAIDMSEIAAAPLELPDLRAKDELKVRNRVRYDNAFCPFEIEEGITLEMMSVQDRYVTFRTLVDVERLDFLLMKENRDSLNAGVIESLRAQLADSAQRQSLLDISDARLGYRNRYVASDKRDSFDISFTPADLARLIAVTDSLARIAESKKK